MAARLHHHHHTAGGLFAAKSNNSVSQTPAASPFAQTSDQNMEKIGL